MSELGPKPDAQIEPGEPNPGGVDATPTPEGVVGDAVDAIDEGPLVRDLDPNDNPAEEALPSEMKQGEDTETAATAGDGDVPPEEESPA